MEIVFSMFRIIIIYWVLGKIFQFFFGRMGRTGYGNNYSRSRTGFGFTKEDPYKVLNVSPFSNDSEIESAYKKLVVQFHPDKTLNMGPDLRKLSEDKMKEINAAYDDIKKQRKRYNAKF
ncbi:MAG: J domain-containing protein [Dehalococcoidia bacterium]|jgi:DnaJ-domain-containing protein 1|nr:J domain-containing protein [Dehalococcoidia bacterium]|tara:strand:+ start:1639 stop:1995 length:357 start_codon:yes stop_codon:yes gene_type:complete